LQNGSFEIAANELRPSDVVLEAVAWREQWMIRYPMTPCRYTSAEKPLDGVYLAKCHAVDAPVLCKPLGSVNSVSEQKGPFAPEAKVEVIDTWINCGLKIGRSRVPMDATDGRIDELVYELYGPADGEIRIVKQQG
jgi:hypothetical protein